MMKALNHNHIRFFSAGLLDAAQSKCLCWFMWLHLYVIADVKHAVMYVCVFFSCLQGPPESSRGHSALRGDGTDTGSLCWWAGGPHTAARGYYHNHQERVSASGHHKDLRASACFKP